jgi:hypothetical protein
MANRRVKNMKGTENVVSEIETATANLNMVNRRVARGLKAATAKVRASKINPKTLSGVIGPHTKH